MFFTHPVSRTATIHVILGMNEWHFMAFLHFLSQMMKKYVKSGVLLFILQKWNGYSYKPQIWFLLPVWTKPIWDISTPLYYVTIETPINPLALLSSHFFGTQTGCCWEKKGSSVAFQSIFLEADEQSRRGRIFSVCCLPPSGWGTYYTRRMFNQH